MFFRKISIADMQQIGENMIKKNDEFVMTIEDMGTEGEGVGRIDGYTVFVKDAIPGDVAKIGITKPNKNFGFARLIEVVTPSKDRVKPVCPVARKCGGCQIQEMSYEAQLAFKEKKVRNNLSRIGKIAPESYEMCKIIGMDNPFHYRNKSQFPVGKDKEGNIITGFFAGRTHSIIECDNCAIGDAINKDILDIVKKHMRKYNIPAYDEKSHSGLVRHVLIRKGFTTGECMVCIVINGERINASDELVEELVKIHGMTSISLSVNRDKTNVIMGNQIIDLYGEGFITDYIGDVKFIISPLSFFQVNPVQTRELYGKALEFAGLTGNETVWDLYCGVGTISLFLAKSAKKVYGVEIVPEAIEDARKNAKINEIDNVEFFVGKAEEVVPKMFKEQGICADVVVVDPPRKGCDQKLLETMVAMSPERIVYVSCDSATLARDLAFLESEGYKVNAVQPVDMFPNSVHVETVVLLSQQKPDDVIEVEIELDELDLTSAESKEYVLKEHGLKVSNLYISQVKRKCGIEVGENYNLPKSEDSRQPQCPVEKEKAIKYALEHFGMV